MIVRFVTDAVQDPHDPDLVYLRGVGYDRPALETARRLLTGSGTFGDAVAAMTAEGWNHVEAAVLSHAATEWTGKIVPAVVAEVSR